MVMNKEFELETKTFEKSGILVEAFEVPGKIALWFEDESKEKFWYSRRHHWTKDFFEK